MWVTAAGSLKWPAATGAGSVTPAPPRRQVQTGGEGGHLCQVTGCTGGQERGPSQPGLLGACPLRVAVGETCWVSSRVFVCFPVRLGLTIQAGMWDEGRGSLLPLTFT